MSWTRARAAIDLCLAPGVAEPASLSRHPQDEMLFLFDACAPSLFRYVRSLGLTAEAGQDVVQEVFLALFHHLRNDRPRDNLKGWVFKVAHNLALKHRRKMKRLQTDFVCDAALAELVIDPALNPEQRMAEEQRHSRLRSIVRALPERDRQCLNLRAEGLRYRDIAAVLGISLGGVAKSLARSFARLANV
jgi:RNA polymerase sigma-70 factor (ECF subfamily)